MGNLIDGDSSPFDEKPNAVIACSNPIPASKVPGKSLRATHGGPILQASKNFLHPFLDRAWQSAEIIQSVGGEFDIHDLRLHK